MNYKTTKEKKIWNDAVLKTVKEMCKYDGVIPHESDRKYIMSEILSKLTYKITGTNP